jgi:murein L,D-transpeptidase YcbB/YkuD
LLGDLPESATVPPDSKIYQGPLVDAVKHFQGRYGLPPTGDLDSKTIAEMNVPLSDRVEQMRLGLERYRWLPYHFKQPPILINVPEFRLYAFEEGNRIGLTMTVNVGDQYDFQTPMFEKNMQYLVFRPYWNPPPEILRNEIIPDLKETPSLEENDLELVGAGGRVINSGDVTPGMWQQLKAGKFTVRQPPGPENALGLVKFIFPNKHHVYIHDTPESENKFSGKERAISHGCIHAQEPAELAAWVLRNNPGWNLERVEKAMHDGPNNVQVNLASPIPVLIAYQTAVVEENGEIHFFHDIYGHDATLEEELAKGYPYPK